MGGLQTVRANPRLPSFMVLFWVAFFAVIIGGVAINHYQRSGQNKPASQETPSPLPATMPALVSTLFEEQQDLPPDVQRLQTRPPLQHSTSFVLFPADANANFPMGFGGKLLAEMDRCAAVGVRRYFYFSPSAREGVTVGMTNVRFHRSCEVKDPIYVTSVVRRVGEKAVTLYVYVERELPGKRELLVDGDITFVAYDPVTKKSIPHGMVLENSEKLPEEEKQGAGKVK